MRSGLEGLFIFSEWKRDLAPFQSGITREMMGQLESLGNKYQIINHTVYRAKRCTFPARFDLSFQSSKDKVNFLHSFSFPHFDLHCTQFSSLTSQNLKFPSDVKESINFWLDWRTDWKTLNSYSMISIILNWLNEQDHSHCSASAKWTTHFIVVNSILNNWRKKMITGIFCIQHGVFIRVVQLFQSTQVELEIGVRRKRNLAS